ncbi:MAG: formyltransferase family protein [Candidatus Omnitrophota bacterium]|nr:formyltransferase family protein [Candidatus Omnitrophota bacterium]
MKLAILTSDIIDGRIVAEELLRMGRSVSAIVYEKGGAKKPVERLRTDIKSLLLKAAGRLKYGSFEEMAGDFRGVKVKFTENINNPDSVDFLNSIRPDLIVVVGTRKLKKEVFSIAPAGAINLHSGILPFYRGSDSEFWALYNNEPDRVGVSIHFIDESLDTGDVIVQERLRVHPCDTIGGLRIKNIYLGAKKINEAISRIEAGVKVYSVQDSNFSKTYGRARPEEKASLKKRLSEWRKRDSVLKVFGDGSVSVVEEVAKKPLITYMKGMKIDYPNIFCLRIDADEYHEDTISAFSSLLTKYRDAITIFVNADNFSDKQDLIKRWHNEGIDIQSHGFYHHTYGDYESNRHNIKKARLFFDGLGIPTKGFVSPAGRWNPGLSRALEDEGYEYSSEFSYDYLGLPTYPSLGSRISNVLQVPVFPVAPELFLNAGMKDIDKITTYYKRAIDEMLSCGLPVIVYAHTSKYKEVPIILNNILEYAISKKSLIPSNMTLFYKWWRGRPAENCYPTSAICITGFPSSAFLGSIVKENCYKMLKRFVRRLIDLERVTPAEELKGPPIRKIMKKFIVKMKGDC